MLNLPISHVCLTPVFLGESDESRNVGCLQTKLQGLPACSDIGSRVPVSVVGVDSGSAEAPQKVAKETISLLVAQLLRTAQEDQRMDGKAPLEGKSSPLSAVSPGPDMERGHSVKEWVRMCFPCGGRGHGVNRCSQVDTGWSGREGQPPGPSEIEVQLTPSGSGWFEGTPAGLAVASGTWARTSLNLK